jgi:hypothetical protein
MCVLISLQLLSETYLILRRIQRDIIIGLYAKDPFSCQILMKLKIFLIFSKNPEI